MEQLIYALKNAMTAEKDAYRTLVGLSERKKDFLISNDVEGLNKLIREETNCVKAMKTLSLERESVLKQIADKKGLLDNLNMDDVIAFASGRLKQELSDLKQEFNRVIISLSRLNGLNKKLIDTHLQYTSFCIETLTQSGNTGDTYSSTGQVSEGNKQSFGFIDQKV